MALLAFNKYLLSTYCASSPEIGSPSLPTHGSYNASTLPLETKSEEGENEN